MVSNITKNAGPAYFFLHVILLTFGPMKIEKARIVCCHNLIIDTGIVIQMYC